LWRVAANVDCSKAPLDFLCGFDEEMAALVMTGIAVLFAVATAVSWIVSALRRTRAAKRRESGVDSARTPAPEVEDTDRLA
jgi:hypothetical protein